MLGNVLELVTPVGHPREDLANEGRPSEHRPDVDDVLRFGIDADALAEPFTQPLEVVGRPLHRVHAIDVREEGDQLPHRPLHAAVRLVLDLNFRIRALEVLKPRKQVAIGNLQQ